LSVFLEHILLLRGIKLWDHRGDVFELVADTFLCLALHKHELILGRDEAAHKGLILLLELARVSLILSEVVHL
jgi:hypothetical protein